MQKMAPSHLSDIFQTLKLILGYHLTCYNEYGSKELVLLGDVVWSKLEAKEKMDSPLQTKNGNLELGIHLSDREFLVFQGF